MTDTLVSSIEEIEALKKRMDTLERTVHTLKAAIDQIIENSEKVAELKFEPKQQSEPILEPDQVETESV